MNSKRQIYIFIVLFLILPLLIYTVLIIYPMISVWYYSFTKWNAIAKPEIIGIKNFIELFRDEDNIRVLQNTGILIMYSLFIQVPIALMIAYGVNLLHSKLSSVLRTLYFFPVIISPIAIGVMFTLVYNGEYGILNQLLSKISPNLAKPWLTDRKLVLHAVLFPDVWRYIGYYIIIFYAGICGIPKSITESAKLDGATPSQIFFKVYIPLMIDVIEVSFILSLSGCFRAFAVPFAITGGGPGVYSSIAALYMYKVSFFNRQMGYGSAIAIEILILALLATVLVKKVFKHESYQF